MVRPREGSAGWRNWAGNQRCQPRGILRPRTLDELRLLIARAAREKERVRPLGAGLAWSALVPTGGYLLDMTGLDRPLGARPGSVRVEAGMRSAALHVHLRRDGQFVDGLPIYTDMTVGGLVATGSHGSGLEGGAIADHVLEMEIVKADGELVRVGRDDPATFRAAQLSLGLLGAVYSVTLRCRPEQAQLVEERVVPLDEGLGRLEQIARENAHVSVYWFPYSRSMWLYTANPTRARATFGSVRRGLDRLRQLVWMHGFGHSMWTLGRLHPPLTPTLMGIGAQLGRTATSCRSSLDAFHYLGRLPTLVDSEYAVPLSRGAEAYGALIDLVRSFQARGLFPVQMALGARFVPGSDAYLSPTSGRDSACVEAATRINPSSDAFYREMAELFLTRLDGRPHWGKLFGDVPPIRARYGAALAHFDAVRRRFDPADMFLDGPLAELFDPRRREASPRASGEPEEAACAPP